MEHRFDPLFFLFLIIIEYLDDRSAKQEDRDDIYDRHQSHRHVRQIPHKRKVCLRAEEDRHDTGDPKYEQQCLIILNEQNIRLCVRNNFLQGC